MINAKVKRADTLTDCTYGKIGRRKGCNEKLYTYSGYCYHIRRVYFYCCLCYWLLYVLYSSTVASTGSCATHVIVHWSDQTILTQEAHITMKRSILTILQFLGLCGIVIAGEEKEGDSWQNCEIFFAPSSLRTGGWGAFAGRDFEAEEIVEITPRYVALHYDKPLIMNSVIDDYIYGYLRWRDDRKEMDPLAAIVFGKAMFYNHNVEPNLRWASFGREPIPRDPTIAMANGFVARRRIEAGEELFSTYGENDGGKQWFQDRRLELMVVPASASRKTGAVYQQDKQNYCSKIYAGFGKPSWEHKVLASVFIEFPYKMNIERLAPVDHPLAVVHQDVAAGTVLEMVPALVVSKDKVVNTLLAPMSFFWADWDATQQQSLKELRESGDLQVQHQDQASEWIRKDRFDTFENVVVVPAAGNIALVQRIVQGAASSENCKMNILSSGSMKSHNNHGGGNGSAGILLQLVATKALKAGDRLVLNVPSNASSYEKQLLLEELKHTGQPIPDFLQAYHESPEQGGEL